MSDIVIYEDGTVALDAQVENETIWLSQKQMAELFGVAIPTINEHIKNIYKEEELAQISTIRKFRIVRQEGGLPYEIMEAFHTIKEQYRQLFLISHESEIKEMFERVAEL